MEQAQSGQFDMLPFVDLEPGTSLNNCICSHSLQGQHQSGLQDIFPTAVKHQVVNQGVIPLGFARAR